VDPSDIERSRLRVGFFLDSGDEVWCSVKDKLLVVEFEPRLRFCDTGGNNRILMASLEDPQRPFRWCNGCERPPLEGITPAEQTYIHKKNIDSTWRTLTGSVSKFHNQVSL
jgi:hypothetical protein